MPINSEKTPKLYVIYPDGKTMELGTINDINISYDFDYDYDGKYLPTQEYEFTARWNPTTKILYFMLHGNFPTNNWLRMHGYRPERKKR